MRPKCMKCHVIDASLLLVTEVIRCGAVGSKHVNRLPSLMHTDISTY
jgi:hypothetical protein